MRTSINPRDSFGGFKDVQLDQLPRNDTELADQLDPNFDHSATMGKSARRISSLLARSDLTSAHDAPDMVDLVNNHSAPSGQRRGPSFGHAAMRSSFGQKNPLIKMHRGVPRVKLQENSVPGGNSSEDSSDTEMIDEHGRKHGPTLGKAHRSLQTDIGFVKIHSFNPLHVQARARGAAPLDYGTVSAFAIESSDQSSPYSNILNFCIFNGDWKQLFVVSLAIPSTTNSQESLEDLQIRVKDIQAAQGVISVCKISDGRRPRIIMLTDSEDNHGTLILQSPGNSPTSIRLPAQLLIRNPFNNSQVNSPLKRREEGLKRVLSDGIDRLCQLRSVPVSNQFDVYDTKKVWHRLEIDLSPNSDFVAKVLNICQLVVPSAPAERDPVWKAWYEIKMWLLAKNKGIVKLEWTALVVTIFSMFTVFLQDRSRSSSVRSKRKIGLLRSSSGAAIDTESFDTMITREDSLGTNTPSWLRSSAWQWALDDLTAPAALNVEQKQTTPSIKKISFLSDCLAYAREFLTSDAGRLAIGEDGYLLRTRPTDIGTSQTLLSMILAALHLLREETKLNTLDSEFTHSLTPLLAQLGGWIGCEEWSWRENCFYSLESADIERWIFEDITIEPFRALRPQGPPPSILQHIEAVFKGKMIGNFPSLIDVIGVSHPKSSSQLIKDLTPRTTMMLEAFKLLGPSPSDLVTRLLDSGWNSSLLETFPEGAVAPLRSAIARCQTEPSTKLSAVALAFVDRDDIAMLEQRSQRQRLSNRPAEAPNHEAIRDFHTICASVLDGDQLGVLDNSMESDRQAVTRLVFKDDQRFTEAAKLVHPLRPAVARCVPEPDWTDTDLLEAQQELAKVIAIRTLSVPLGRAMLLYNARFPLLTERLPIPCFTLSCIMKPTNTTVTAQRDVYSDEEKVSWAFFHAGVQAGLSVSKGTRGINTSWIMSNKPKDLGNRHAGFLLALGLNGHLKSIAKWVAFKYLTPKHTMTSIGLLLGLAASYLGTMDSLVTRLLSVHVTRMLPPGAAELNLSPLTQTTGILGLGLLYCNTQHRRMSEVMLSEMENIEQDDNTNPLEGLRGEGYRLAAGFALGYINLGQGKRLKGLYDMRIVERLLALAVATKKVNLVHILDKATAGATVAIALLFLKTEDSALAKKIDVPDTLHQFEYVRPDIFLLRTIARNLIMWKAITPTLAWMQQQLPPALRSRVRLSKTRFLRTEDLPLFNIIAGLCVSIGLRFAGSARQDVRDLLGLYLDQFIRINRLSALHYDGKLTRITTRNCQDAVALAAASVMAGTGDIYLLRRFRALHGRCDLETPYGSHLAAHQAIGVLFLGGGTHTFNTSDIAIASLLCAFYPLFPTTIQDCKSHLQAFRHLWTFAAEPRCIIVRSAETHRPLSLPIVIVLCSGKELDTTAPCLLPELDTIARIYSNDPQYWRVTVDFTGNPAHLAAFKRHQSMFVRRRGPYDASSSVFSATMQALNNKQAASQIRRQAFEWVFDLAFFSKFDRAERALILPAETSALIHMAGRTTVVDDRLALEECMGSWKAERLWNLRILFAWAKKVSREGGEMMWLGKEVVEGLKARIALMQ